ncbi:hypothetical protein ACTNC1_10890 [Atopobiaceae bacterium HCP3S3_A4]
MQSEEEASDKYISPEAEIVELTGSAKCLGADASQTIKEDDPGAIR